MMGRWGCGSGGGDDCPTSDVRVNDGSGGGGASVFLRRGGGRRGGASGGLGVLDFFPRLCSGDFPGTPPADPRVVMSLLHLLLLLLRSPNMLLASFVFVEILLEAGEREEGEEQN